MKRSSRILVALALATGLAFAPAPASAQDVGVVGELERVEATTPQQKLTYAADAIEEMRAAVATVSRLLEAARREGNVEKLQCINNRFTALRMLLQVSEAAEPAMRDALAQGATERAEHEFRKLTVARNKGRQLLAEADRCGDESTARGGDTTLRFEQGIGEADDTAPVPFDELDIGFDPPEASPFM